MTDATEEGLAARLQRHAADRPDAVAFRFLGRHARASTDISWAELWRESRQRASRLLAADVRDRQVGILCPDPQDFVVSLVAAILAGATAVPMPTALSRRSAPRLHATVRASDLAAIIAPNGLLTTGWLDEIDWPLNMSRISVESLQVGSFPPHVALSATDLTAPLLLQFTSGSTGAAQGVLLSHANVAANCAAIAAAYELDSKSIALAWLPLHHDMGLVGHVLTPIWVGFRSCIMNPLLFLQKPLRWLEAVGDERATITSAPNFAYELCNRAIENVEGLDLDLGGLTTAICGGEPVMSDTVHDFLERFGRFGFRRSAFAPSYGLAEATLLVTTARSAEGPVARLIPAAASGMGPSLHHTCVGPPVAGTRVRVVEPQSRVPLASEEVGEIEVAGASVGRVVGATHGEWTPTGDLGYLLEDRLFVVGRCKELIILSGENVFPADVEAAALRSSQAIVPGGVAAIGVEQAGTQTLVLVVEIRPNIADDSALEGVRKTVRESVALATGHVPVDVVLLALGSLPRTTSGKLRRHQIAALYRSGQLLPIAGPGAHLSEDTYEHV